jgi:hypothetical protein
MDLAVIGATGRTGRLVVETALARGHRLRVLVRDPARLSSEVANRVRVVTGDAGDPHAARQLLVGTEALVSALGPTAKEPDLHTRTARMLVSIMNESGPRRFVGISGAGIDVPGDQKAVRDKIISKSIQLLGGSIVKDKPAEYAVWAASGLDCCICGRHPSWPDGEDLGGRGCVIGVGHAEGSLCGFRRNRVLP